MTELLDKAVHAVRRMTAAEQDTIADAMLSMARIGASPGIDPDHLQDVLEGLAEIRRGEIAGDEEVEAAVRSFGR